MTTASSALLRRAERVFPGSKHTRLPLQAAWARDRRLPSFLVRGQGSRVVDVDGREFIDYHCGFGASVLGYASREVEEAAAAAAAAAGGATLTGPTALSVDLAERLVDLRPACSWALLAKNGSDVTGLARTVARAATGRRAILREYSGATSWAYHGSGSWARAAAGVPSPGVLPEEAVEVGFVYNDLGSVERAIRELGAERPAAIFVGGCSYPYSAPTVCPTADFARGLREIASREGALLVLDEIRTNFRVGGEAGAAMAPGGHWGALGADADIYCISKALGNGHPIAALVGAESARAAAAEVMATGTYWLSPAPMAAALSCLRGLEADDGAATARMSRLGAALADGLREEARRHGFAVTVSGPPSMPFMTFDEEAPHARPLAERWCAAAAGGGAWLHPHHNWYLSSAHTEEDIDLTLAAAARAFAEVAGAGA